LAVHPAWTQQRLREVSMVRVICANKRCGCEFEARQADINRGWGKYCSKSCKAVKQEKRTGQYRQFIERQFDEDEVDISDMDFGASDGGGYYDKEGLPI
jgi:hypothetical protein